MNTSVIPQEFQREPIYPMLERGDYTLYVDYDCKDPEESAKKGEEIQWIVIKNKKTGEESYWMGGKKGCRILIQSVHFMTSLGIGPEDGLPILCALAKRLREKMGKEELASRKGIVYVDPHTPDPDSDESTVVTVLATDDDY